jgi:hypothetical protein
MPSVTSAFKGVQDAPSGLAEAFLTSLRRDAFVMEAGAYEDPALAQQTEFERLYPAVHRQLQCLFGQDVLTVLAVDAQIKDRDNARAREMVLGYHWERDGGELPVFCRVAAGSLLLPLSEVLWKPEQLSTYSSVAFPLKSALQDWTLATGIQPRNWTIAPYVVRPVFSRRPSRHLLEVLELMESKLGDEFLHTSAFLHTDASPTHEWSDAYYLASLFVLTSQPPPGPLLPWLEALHVSFQLSWGFPVLAAQRQIAVDMKAQNTRLRRVHDLAQTVSQRLRESVLNETAKILRELDHGQFLDNEELEPLFDTGEQLIYRGAGYSVETRHRPNVSEAALRNFLAVAFHRLFGHEPESGWTEDYLLQSTTEIINKQAAPWPPFQKLLHSCLEHPINGFQIFKELCLSPHREDGELSFYSFALRVLIRQGAEAPLQVVVRSNEGNEWALTLKSLDTHRKSDDLTFATPRFPRAKRLAPKLWAIPLVRFVESLQIRPLENNHVFVSKIAIEDHAGADVLMSITLDVSPQDASRKAEFISAVQRHFDNPVILRDSLNDFRHAAAALKAAVAETTGGVSVQWPPDSCVVSIRFAKQARR